MGELNHQADRDPPLPCTRQARQFGSYVLGSSQEPLEAVRRVTAAMQEMNNPLNRWLPWRKVRLGAAATPGCGCNGLHSKKSYTLLRRWDAYHRRS
jgi:hypothetical protein